MEKFQQKKQYQDQKIHERLYKLKTKQTLPYQQQFSEYNENLKQLTNSNKIFYEFIQKIKQQKQENPDFNTHLELIKKQDQKNRDLQQQLAKTTLAIEFENEYIKEEEEQYKQTLTNKKDELNQKLQQLEIQKQTAQINSKQLEELSIPKKINYRPEQKTYIYKINTTLLQVVKDNFQNLVIFHSLKQQDEAIKPILNTSYSQIYNRDYISSIDFEYGYNEYLIYGSVSNDKSDYSFQRYNFRKNEIDYTWCTCEETNKNDYEFSISKYFQTDKQSEQHQKQNQKAQKEKEKEQSDIFSSSDSDEDIIIRSYSLKLIQVLKNYHNRVIFCTQQGYMNMYEISENKHRFIFSTKLPSNAVSITEDPQERIVYVGLSNGYLIAYHNLENDKPDIKFQQRIFESGEKVSSLAMYNSKKKYIAATSTDFTSKIALIDISKEKWWVKTWNFDKEGFSNEQQFNNFCFMNEKTILIGGDDANLYQFEFDDYKQTLSLKNQPLQSTHKSPIIFVHYDEEKDSIYTGDTEGLILVRSSLE